MVIRGPKPRDVEELPDVLADTPFDLELYATPELRQALAEALRAQVRDMTELGLPGGSFYETIRRIDDAGAGVERG